MAVIKAISGNDYKNNGSNMLHAGSVVSDTVNTIDYGLTSMDVISQPNVSGLTMKPISAGDFNVDNRLVSMGYTTNVGGNDVNVLVGGAGIQQRKAINAYPGYNQYGLESFDILTGTPTYNANRGVFIQPSGLDDTVGQGADNAANPTYQVPGSLVYQFGSNVPKQDDYDPRTA